MIELLYITTGSKMKTEDAVCVKGCMYFTVIPLSTSGISVS